MIELIEIIKELAKISVPIIILYLKLYFDNKKNRGIEQKNTDYRIDVFNKLDEKIDNMYDDLKIHTNKDDDDSMIRTSLQREGLNIISANSDLSQQIIHLLMSGQMSLSSFVAEYYTSNFRKNKKEREEFLALKINTIKGKLKQIALQQFPVFRKYKNEEVNFIKFLALHPIKIDATINVFVKTLVRNGLNHEKYISECNDFLENMFKESIIIWRDWKELEKASKLA